MTSNFHPNDNSSPNSGDIAADWVARELARKLSANERAELDVWLEVDPEHQSAYAEAWSAYAEAGQAASDEEMLAMRSAALAQGAQSRRSPYVFAGLAMAAAVLLALVGPQFFQSNRIDPNRAPAATQTAAMRTHYQTGIGERLTATLDDGSTITLNTASEVRIDYTPNARRIELLKGQALFSVAHDQDWPFEVYANGRAIRALGTEFDVRLIGQSIEVVLVEGRVAVGPAREIAAGDLRRASQLEAGERLTMTSVATQVTPANAEIATSWRRGRVTFDNTPLPEAIAEINRYRATPIRINDPRVAALVISGTYRTSDAMSFEQALAHSFNVQDDRDESGAVVLNWRGEDAE